MKRIKSKLFSLNTWDTVKSAIVAILASFVAKVFELWVPGLFPGKVHLLSVFTYCFIGYLIKQFGTNSQGLPRPEPKPQEDEIPTPSTPADRV